MQFQLKTPAKTPAIAIFFCVLLTLLVKPAQVSAASSAIFGRERLFTLNAADTSVIKSHYSTVILFVVDVESNGDLNYNGNHLLVQNGVYVGDTGWGARLAALKTAPTTVNRIEVCTGGSGAPSFVHIQNLIASQGTGPNSILYRNFQALKRTLGVDAIDYDDEVDYDSGSAVAFGNLVSSLGMSVTLCPYDNQDYWQSVQSQLGPKVDAVYLQCYDGGAGNDPGYWNTLFNGLKVTPGDWDNDGLDTLQSKMSGWASADGVVGGFFWLLDDGDSTQASQFGAAINTGIGGPYGLTATSGNNSVTLNWTQGTGGRVFSIYRGTSEFGEAAVPIKTNVTATRFTDTGLTNGTPYFYYVVAAGSAGVTAPTDEASATPRKPLLVTQLLANTGFESGVRTAPWVATPGVITNAGAEAAHSGQWKAWLCGYGTTHTDTLGQTVTIPAAAVSATLRFFLHIDTADRTGLLHDTLKVQVRSTSGAVLSTLGTYSNLNAAGGYSLQNFDLSAYAGQTVQVSLVGSENGSLQTSFVTDDFTLNVQ